MPVLPVTSLFALIGAVWSCQSTPGGDPDGNRLLQNPTYQVTFNPPPSWTFHVVVGTTAPAVFPGQWATAEQASRTFQGNVRDAVFTALREYGQIGLANPTFAVSGYTPEDIPISPTGAFAQDQYKVESGAVVGKFGAAATEPLTPYVKTAQIAVSNGPLLTKNQWRQLGNDVLVQLQNSYSARVTNITITTSN
ncbi:hypothetical protein AAVH_05842 [Aphelenchoides avenae]|nr:hypothetical protein AAVH_05842 [Aphelenchus avenae]